MRLWRALSIVVLAGCALPVLAQDWRAGTGRLEGKVALAHLQLGEVAECRADFEKVVERASGTPQGDLARKALEQVR